MSNLYELRNVNGVYAIGVNTPVGFLPMYATADWDGLTEFITQIAECYLKMAEAREESVPESIAKTFPERI